MDKRTQFKIVFLGPIVYLVVLVLLKGYMDPVVGGLLLVVWGLLVAYFIKWMMRNTEYFEVKGDYMQTLHHRMKILHDIGVHDFLSNLGYFSAGLLVALGVYGLMSSRPDGYNLFLGSTLIALMILAVVFTTDIYRKKRY